MIDWPTVIVSVVLAVPVGIVAGVITVPLFAWWLEHKGYKWR